jgi:hypothetical protein
MDECFTAEEYESMAGASMNKFIVELSMKDFASPPPRLTSPDSKATLNRR